MGKTFRESVLKHFEKQAVSSVEAIVITHGHCDAYGGLDDVRDLTDRKPGMRALGGSFSHAFTRLFVDLLS
jgi:phosphoribosyl 1,2-cyclic phosphodiesterase